MGRYKGTGVGSRNNKKGGGRKRGVGGGVWESGARYGDRSGKGYFVATHKP